MFNMSYMGAFRRGYCANVEKRPCEDWIFLLSVRPRPCEAGRCTITKGIDLTGSVLQSRAWMKSPQPRDLWARNGYER